MMNAEEKKRMTTMKRRKMTVIIAAILVAIMSVALVFVYDYVRTTTVIDPADNAEYYVRYKNKEYGLYYSDKKTKLPTDTEYGYYVTKAQTLIEVDAQTGEYTIQAVLDDLTTEGSEKIDHGFKRLLFPHTEKANIRSLEVHNETGTYTFARINENGEVSNNGDFVILSSPVTPFNEELFTTLYTTAGFTISTQKIQDPIKDANGQFTEYGLAPIANRERVLEDGTVEIYDHTPSYYVLTDTSGNKHKVLVGDRLVTGGGYYVQYVAISDGKETPRDAVYVLNTDIEKTVLASIEDYVTPLISYPMTMNTYFDVEDFKVLKRYENKAEDDKYKYEEMVSFTYIDIADRQNTLQSNIPYVFNQNSESPAAALDGYLPSSNNISTALGSIYAPSYVGVYKFAPSNEDFAEVGLSCVVVDENGEPVLDKDGNKTYEACAKYSISFKYDITDDKGKYVETIQQLILVSEKNENGNYYVFTTVYSPAKEEGKKAEYLYDYNMIVEIEGHSLGFLEWDAYDWISSNYVTYNIAFVEGIKIESPNYNAEFKLDNSLSDQSTQISSNLLQVTGTDSNGKSTTTFAQKIVTDVNGVKWVITATDIKAYNSMGTELKITTSRYEYNKLGTQAKVDTGGIKDKNGDVVYVEADYIKITHPDGTTDQICRFDSSLFRKFYQTLLAATIIDSYPTTDAEREEILSGGPMLTLTVKTNDGKEYVYRFYELTTRKAYITINGNGGFYVSPNRVQKFVTDAQRFFDLEVIDASDKF
jgi:hypothetical protein